MKAPIPDISRDLFDLTGYCSIVTGASVGIGLSLAEALAYGAQWQGVFDVVFQVTRRRAIGFEAMGMLPERERTLHLAVAELTALDVVEVFGNPTYVSGSDGYLENGA